MFRPRSSSRCTHPLEDEAVSRLLGDRRTVVPAAETAVPRSVTTTERWQGDARGREHGAPSVVLDTAAINRV
jgi:hypothetical protein